MSEDERKLESLLEKMREQALPVQVGGFSVSAVPTGISSFDLSTGVGGFPHRRITIIQGQEGSGKTLLLLSAIAHVQSEGGRAAFIDLEHALTPNFAVMLGVDYDALVVSRPRTLNEAYDVAKEFVSSGLFDIVGFDSAVALATVEEIERSASEKGSRAGKAQVHSLELPKIISSMTSDTAFVIVNQLRDDPNPAPGVRFKRTYTPGGRALRFHSSLTVNVSPGEVHRESKARVGNKIKTYIVKNKVAQPFKSAEFDIMYATGLDLVSDLIDTAISLGIIKRKSSWFYIDFIDPSSGEISEFKFSGRAKLEEEMRDNEDLHDFIQNECTLIIGTDTAWDDV